jgi:long-chain acyl-CoA synthetase
MPAVEAASAARPWLAHYGNVPRTLEYPEATLYQAVRATVERLPDALALDFLDHRVSYKELGDAIERCAGALQALGIGPGDRILIATPTCPQGVIGIYAANRLGAVSALVHPLSTPEELTHYLDITGARFVLTLDAFHAKFAGLHPAQQIEAIVLARIGDYLHGLKRMGYAVKYGRKIPRVPPDPRVHWWADLMRAAPLSADPVGDAGDLAVIMFSGGTTGLPKAIMLSNRNIISEGLMVAAWMGMREGDRVLAIMPLFHGFGFGGCINAPLICGGAAVMVPSFTPHTVARLIKSKRPNMMGGVPTLFEALSRDPALQKVDLSCLRATVCGADRLPRPVKERFESLVAARGGNVRLVEGYGLTETVTGVILMPRHEYREGSIGLPFPDMLAAICRPGGTEEVPVSEEGEICLAGPAVMLGYLGDPRATADALRIHPDGRTWLHTGDLGRMDADGFFYFTCRLKRMIKSSGFNVYPAQVEEVLQSHPAIAEACVIGVPDPAQVERVVAVVALKDQAAAGAGMERELIEYCRARLIKWSCPREVEFVAELPKTKLGKVDYGALARRARELQGAPG